MLLSRDDILGAEDLETIEIEVPEWGGTVRARELTGEQRSKFENYVSARMQGDRVTSTKGVRAKLISMSLITANGELMFSEKELDKLEAKSARAIERLFLRLQTFNGLAEDSVAEAEGNS